MNPWKKFKYILLFMNLFFAATQGLFLYINIMGNFTHWLFFFQISLISFFLYMGISNFRQHCRLDRAWQVVNDDLERMLEELTLRIEGHRMNEHVNWKRDGF